MPQPSPSVVTTESGGLQFGTTETAIVDKPAEQADDHGHGHHHGHAH
jgi:hypothetical protein